MPFSKTLAKIAKEDPRVDEYEFDAGNDCGEHWLHLAWPWIDPDDGCGSIHEYTVREVLSRYKDICKPNKEVILKDAAPELFKVTKAWVEDLEELLRTSPRHEVKPHVRELFERARDLIKKVED